LWHGPVDPNYDPDVAIAQMYEELMDYHESLGKDAE
jgi:hypothetical protein